MLADTEEEIYEFLRCVQRALYEMCNVDNGCDNAEQEIYDFLRCVHTALLGVLGIFKELFITQKSPILTQKSPLSPKRALY